MKTNQLAIKQLDKQLTQWHKARFWFQPRGGWVRVIRKTLGVTTNQLAERLGVDRSRVIKIESDEVREALTMKTLIATANALNCDFIYALVPRESLKKTIERQANKIATLQVNRIAHNMLLEDQMLLREQNKEQVEELKNELLSKSYKKLWNKT